jgi:CheY-like chemotaxis protein
MFAVADTGPGIPESIVPTLFEADRSSSGSERRGSGSGMGLAIVRLLIEHLGGEIAVTSRPEVGTTFTLRIPAAPADGFEASREGGSGKVLVVDDRIDVLDAMIDVIQELGFACDRATSASAGAYLLATRHYDAAFVDIDMPTKGGVQLVDEARQGTGPNRSAQFVGMSAADVPAAVRERFHQCLAKPVDRSTLQRALRSIYPAASANQQKLWH